MIDTKWVGGGGGGINCNNYLTFYSICTEWQASIDYSSVCQGSAPEDYVAFQRSWTCDLQRIQQDALRDAFRPIPCPPFPYLLSFSNDITHACSPPTLATPTLVWMLLWTPLTPKFDSNSAKFCPPHPGCIHAAMKQPLGTHPFHLLPLVNLRNAIFQCSCVKIELRYYGKLSNSCGKFFDHVHSLCNGLIPL